MWRPRAYALRRAPADVAKEAVDETFLIAWRKLPDLPRNALPWLLVVARNAIISHTRSGRRVDVLAQELRRLRSVAVSVDVSDAVIERAVVLEALAALSDADRDALMLTVWDGLSASDAGRVVGCSTTAFAVRLHRARRRLRDALARIDAADPSGPLPAIEEVR